MIESHEIDSIYTGSLDRYVVSFIVSYGEEDFDQSRFENSPLGAAQAALELTRDDGASDTIWFVYDRETEMMHQFTQGEFG
jgi:hypothetical protein